MAPPARTITVALDMSKAFDTIIWEVISVSSCICCMFVSGVHPVAVLNAEFCMACSFLMLVEDARGDHMEEAYSRAGFMTAL